MSMDYWTKYFGSNSLGFHISSDDEDIEEFRSEKSVKSGKSSEEIEKFIIDESMSDLDRTHLLLSTGQDIQKLCVIEHLPNLLKTQQMETLAKVIPKLCDVLPSSSVDVQVLASQMLGEAVRGKLIPVHLFITSCLPTVLKQLENRDQVVSKAWLGTVLACIGVLPKEDLKRKILTLAISKGQLSQTVNSRQISCRIVGEIANRFSLESKWLKCEVLPLATALCQDVDSTVRQLMCEQLSVLARALGSKQSEESLFPELVELLNDEESTVRVSALEALTELLSLWSQDCLSKQVIPLVQTLYEFVAKNKDWTLIEGVARLLGKICYGLREVVNKEQLEWFVTYYNDLQQRQFPAAQQGVLLPEATSNQAVLEPRTECRHLCAFNFPAMLFMVGKDSFDSKLASGFKSMAQDKSWRVRKTIACGFHEVVEILEEKASSVSSLYQALLKDSSVEVLNGLVPHLPLALKAFANFANLSLETKHPGLSEFINPLLALDQVASSQRQWRLHKDFVTVLKSVVCCFTSDQIHSKIIPLVQSHITGKTVLPVKKVAGHTLCVLIRNNRRQNQRKDLIAWFIKELAKSSSCQRRLLFIEVCTYILEVYSSQFFKKNIFEILLELAHDPVINIRLRLYQLFPMLKSILKLPTDRELLQELELTVRKLIVQERDSDASQSIRDAVLAMDRIEVSMETYTRRTYFEGDLADQQKEMEEKLLLESEEKEKVKLEKTKKGVKKVATPIGTPRENKKLPPSLHESKSTASPALPHKPTTAAASKVKTSSSLQKTISAPSSAELSCSPTQSPSHNQARRKAAGNKGSPPMRNVSASSLDEKKGSGASKTVAASASNVAASKSSGGSGKKKAQNYGLEYSSKGKTKKT